MVMKMASNKTGILLVEDDHSLARVYQEYMRNDPYTLTLVDNGGDALEALPQAEIGCVILDLHLPDMSGFEILEKSRELRPGLPVVVITARGSIDTAVKAMQAGAADFVIKPFKADRLRFTLRNALERQQLQQIVDDFRRDNDRGEFCGFVGKSLAMQEIYRVIERVAKSKATVFVTGESGTGKEVSAQAIHDLSPRRNKPFVALNCGAIPKDLIESEIFGHVKGSFTGAIADRDGAAAQANGGTLFLDEICEMEIDLQVKLLRFVQTDSYRRVGGAKTESVDVRIICATNRNPWDEVQQGRFREDLYYRLHVIPLHLPPLGQREDDVLQLAAYFLRRYAAEEGKNFTGIEEEAKHVLLTRNWPGNVRELQNLVRNIVVLDDGPLITAAMLGSSQIGQATPNHPNKPPRPVTATQSSENVGSIVEQIRPDDAPLKPLWQSERDLIHAALDHFDGNVQKAAGALEISPSTLYRRLRELKENETALIA